MKSTCNSCGVLFQLTCRGVAGECSACRKLRTRKPTPYDPNKPRPKRTEYHRAWRAKNRPPLTPRGEARKLAREARAVLGLNPTEENE